MTSEPTTQLLDVAGRRISQRALMRGLRVNMVAGALGNAWAAMALGMATTMFMECNGASGVMIGLIVTVQQLAMVTQIPASLYAERLASRKRYWATLALAQRLVWLVPAGLPRLAAAGMLAIVALSSILTHACAACWYSWIADLVPERIRGRFWGVRQSITMAAYLLAMAAAGWLLDAFPDPRTPGGSFTGFSLCFAAAAVVGVLDILIHLAVPEPRPTPRTVHLPILEQLLAPLRDRDFLWITLSFGVWAMTVGLTGSFSVIYLTREFNVSYTEVAATSIAAGLSTVLIGMLWGRLMDRIGARAFGALMLAVTPLFSIVWFLVDDSVLSFTLPVIGSFTVHQPIFLLVVVNLLAGGFYAGVSLCQFNLSSMLAPKEGRTLAMAVHWTLVGLIGAVGPLAGGAITDYFARHPLNTVLPTGTHLTFYHALVVLHALLLWLGVLPLLMRVRRREGDVSVHRLVGNPLRVVGILNNMMAAEAAASRTRARAVRRLGDQRVGVAVETLIERLDDPASEVREESVAALGRVGTPAAVSALVERLEAPACDLAPQIARALRGARNPEAVDALLRRMAGDEHETQAECARTLGEIGDPRAVSLLLHVLRSTQDARVLVACADALAHLHSFPALPEILQRAREAPSDVVRNSLALAAGALLGNRDEFYALLTAETEHPGSLILPQLARVGRLVERRPVFRPRLQALRLMLEALEEACENQDGPAVVETMWRDRDLISPSVPSAHPEGRAEAASDPLHKARVLSGLWYLGQLHQAVARKEPVGPIEVLLGVHFVVSCLWAEG
ncbi:MAG: Major Facilitator Superfamily protein [Lentisphaerae bacterium ADurb.BinA184]|nr:MAG: Major Facilitator Superfamily protein [Lentisphaerae bacterium ADurb.BinA184]